ncbi:helix-turn-helix domain-containing protein [Thalassospira sp. SM2505]
MNLVPVTYIKAGETPANWFDLSVIDNATGKDVRFVVEADTKAGWVRQQALGRDGRFLRFAGEIVTRRIEGDFSVVNPGVPGCPVEMQPEPEPVPAPAQCPEPEPRAFPTTRIFFDRGTGATLAGPGGSVRCGSQVSMLLMMLCGKPERHVSAWMDIAESLWPHPDDMPDSWREVIDVQVCRLRAALKSIDSEITIVTHWGRGYSAARGPYANNDNHHEAPAASASA